MSKFIKKLERNSQATPQPLGFGRYAQAKVEAGMRIIADVAQVDKNLTDYVAGADAAILPAAEVRAGVKILQKACQAASTVLWGLHTHDMSPSDVKDVIDAGADFVVVSTESMPFVTEENGLGKILEVELTIDDHLLRTVDDLPLDCVIINDNRDSAMNWQQLMKLQYLSNLFSKPLVVTAPANISSNEIQLLWEAGVDAIKVNVGPGITANLKELREAIDKLDLPSLRKPQKKATAILPRMAEERTATHGTEPDEEDEDDD